MPKENDPNAFSNAAHADLIAALASMKNVSANKLNPAFKARYVSLDALLDSVKEVLHAHNLALRQVLVSEDGKVGVQTALLHISGTSFDCGKLMVKSDGLTPQQVGSALTYIRRQSIQTACGISTDLDDDGASSSSGSSQSAFKSPAPKATPFVWYGRLTSVQTPKAIAYCIKRGFIEKGQTLSDVPATISERITASWDSFVTAVDKEVVS